MQRSSARSVSAISAKSIEETQDTIEELQQEIMWNRNMLKYLQKEHKE